MLKIISINRKLSQDPTDSLTGIAIEDTNCNVVIAADRYYNKAHFELTDDEEAAFEIFCRRIEQRIAGDIANTARGLEAIAPLDPPERQKEEAFAAHG